MEEKISSLLECRADGGIFIELDNNTFKHIPENIKNVIDKTMELSEVIDVILEKKPFDMEVLKAKEYALQEAVHKLEKFRYIIHLG